MTHDYHDPDDEFNGPKYQTGKPCIEGCGRPAGTHWSPLWCQPCNAARMDKNGAQFARVADALKGAPMKDAELADEIERHMSHRPFGFVIPPYPLYEADAKHVIAALRRLEPEAVMLKPGDKVELRNENGLARAYVNGKQISIVRADSFADNFERQPLSDEDLLEQVSGMIPNGPLVGELRRSPDRIEMARAFRKALRQPSSDQVLAEMILKCRDALIQADYTEAWHWLYQLQEKVGSGHDPYKPWEHLERLLAAEAEGRKT